MPGERGAGSGGAGEWPVRRALKCLAFALALSPLPRSPCLAQSRFWRPEDRTLFTDFSYVTAVATTLTVVYAATPGALVIYDRATGRLRDVVGTTDGYPPGGASVMVADPNDDTAWLAARGQWFMYRPWGREWESGPLDGQPFQVVLDAGNPAGGAWYQTTAGWQQIQRGGFPGPGGTPPQARIGALTADQVRRAAPAIETVLMRVTRDAALRVYPVTMAAQSPVDRQLFLATAGNGVFAVDPVGLAAEQLPAGLLAPGAAGLALTRTGVCAGTDDRFAWTLELAAGHGRRGVTCVSDDGAITPYEVVPGIAAAGAQVRGVATGRGGVVWAVSDAGVLRFAREGAQPARLTGADGLPSEDARAIAVDSAAGGVWVGTSLGLAFVTDADHPQVTAATSFGAAVGALATGRDTLWIGSAAGLVLLARGASAPVAVTGTPALRDPVVAVAVRGDTVVAATPHRILWRAGGAWSDIGPATPNIGPLVAVSLSGEGVWAAGSNGIALFQTRGGGGQWTTWTAPGDLPSDVASIAAGSRYVWVGTRFGLVRFDKRALLR